MRSNDHKPVLIGIPLIFSLLFFVPTLLADPKSGIATSDSFPDSAAYGIERIQRCPADFTWTSSRVLPPGAETVVLEGDPTKEGFFTTRLRLPANYVLPPHTHPKDERITVLEGNVYLGFGDSVDVRAAKAFGPGCFYINPTGSKHYVFTLEQGAVVQLSGPGPWGIDFLRR